MKPFNLYDILGVLAPGAVVTVGVMALFPEAAAILNNKDISLGDLGLVVLVSYVTGNLVAALGDILEGPYFAVFGGLPTQRVKKNGGSVIPKREFTSVETKLREVGLLNGEEAIAKLTGGEWHAVTRQMHTYLDARGRTGRIEMFNAQYGMNRGIAAGFCALIVLLLVQQGWAHWQLMLILFGCVVLAVIRMHRFGVYYAKELFRQFLTAPAAIKTGSDNRDEE